MVCLSLFPRGDVTTIGSSLPPAPTTRPNVARHGPPYPTLRRQPPASSLTPSYLHPTTYHLLSNTRTQQRRQWPPPNGQWPPPVAAPNNITSIEYPSTDTSSSCHRLCCHLLSSNSTNNHGVLALLPSYFLAKHGMCRWCIIIILFSSGEWHISRSCIPHLLQTLI